MLGKYKGGSLFYGFKLVCQELKGELKFLHSLTGHMVEKSSDLTVPPRVADMFFFWECFVQTFI